MPDNSRYKGLPRGRHPSPPLLTVPFRVEEWGKERRVQMPEWWPEALKVMASGRPYYPSKGREQAGTALKGRPGLGTLAIFIGAKVSEPRQEWMPSAYEVVLEGFARTEKEAKARVTAFVKARFAERLGKARRRAKAKQDAGVQTSGSESAFRAKTGSRAGKLGT